MLYTHYVRSATQFDALKRAQTIPRLNNRLQYARRAHVFCFTSHRGHAATAPLRPFRANKQHQFEMKVAARAADIAPIIRELQKDGAGSLRAIAEGLNEAGIPTARGQGQWSTTQVKRVLDLLDLVQ